MYFVVRKMRRKTNPNIIRVSQKGISFSFELKREDQGEEESPTKAVCSRQLNRYVIETDERKRESLEIINF